MSRGERLGFRDETYSRWHRAIPLELDFIDVDWMERCATCKRIVAIYELARDVGQEHKDAWAIRDLARRSSIPGLVVLYRVEGTGISGFRVRSLYPSEQAAFESITPDEWIARLRRFRCHEVQRTSAADMPAEPFLASKDAWRALPQICHTCGSEPIGRFPDGSPLYRCHHALTA